MGNTQSSTPNKSELTPKSADPETSCGVIPPLVAVPENAGKKWSINQGLAVERDFDLLKLPVDKIATKHGRSIGSIIFKLMNDNVITRERAHEIASEYTDDDKYLMDTLLGSNH